MSQEFMDIWVSAVQEIELRLKEQDPNAFLEYNSPAALTALLVLVNDGWIDSDGTNGPKDQYFRASHDERAGLDWLLGQFESAEGKSSLTSSEYRHILLALSDEMRKGFQARRDSLSAEAQHVLAAG